MLCNLKKVLVLVALTALFSVLPAAGGEAAFIAAICNDVACSGGNDLFAFDGGAGDLDSTIPGSILFAPTKAYHGYEVVINTSQSKPAIKHGMDLSYTITNTKGGVLGAIFLYAIDTDFVGPAQLTGLLGGVGPAGVTTTARICNGDANTNDFAPCTSASTTAALVSLVLSHIGSANPYAMSIGVSVSGLGKGQTATGSFQVTAVPEPATAALMAVALAAVGAYGRRRPRGQPLA